MARPNKDSRLQTPDSRLQTADRLQTPDSRLLGRVSDRIRKDGPISFHDWMEMALYDARDGYYNRVDLRRWGREGDYRTSPERSPLFASTIASQFAEIYGELGSPESFMIVEAGAGAGDFALGILNTISRRYSDLFAACRYVVDEKSEDARNRCREKLSEFIDRVDFRRLSSFEAPIEKGIVFSNELLDSFPVHRVKRIGGQTVELYVGLSDSGEFHWQDCEPCSRVTTYLEKSGIDIPDGHVADLGIDAGEWMLSAASVLKEGYIITVDYGSDSKSLYADPGRRSGTLRCFSKHRLVDDPLSRPGEQDLTTTIDWTQIIRAGESGGLETIRLERLDQYLLGEGILNQLELAISQTRTEAEALVLRAGLREMILPNGMCSSFQVLVQKAAQ
jgi:SAM-dependent MidA family methyltransferase